MNQLMTAGFRTLGMFFAVIGALSIEKYLDLMEITRFSFWPLGILLFGLILFYSVRD